MKARELRELSSEELKKRLVAVKKDLADIRFKHSLNQLENPLSIRELRKDITRINTLITEMERAK